MNLTGKLTDINVQFDKLTAENFTDAIFKMKKQLDEMAVKALMISPAAFHVSMDPAGPYDDYTGLTMDKMKAAMKSVEFPEPKPVPTMPEPDFYDYKSKMMGEWKSVPTYDQKVHAEQYKKLKALLADGVIPGQPVTPAPMPEVARTIVERICTVCGQGESNWQHYAWCPDDAGAHDFMAEPQVTVPAGGNRPITFEDEV